MHAVKAKARTDLAKVNGVRIRTRVASVKIAAALPKKPTSSFCPRQNFQCAAIAQQPSCGKFQMFQKLGGGSLKDALPSTDLKSHQAMHAVLSTPGRSAKTMTPDSGPLSAADKIHLIQAIHENLAHFGGRDSAVAAIKQAGTTWPNMRLDVSWVLRRCKHCLGSPTKGTTRQSLPSPAAKEQQAAMQTLGQFYLIKAKLDGACLLRCFAMGKQQQAGVAPDMIADNAEQGLEIRKQVAQYSESLVLGMPDAERGTRPPGYWRSSSRMIFSGS